jgi:hypothetical protein
LSVLRLHGLLAHFLDNIFIRLLKHGKVLKVETTKVIGQCWLTQSPAS